MGFEIKVDDIFGSRLTSKVRHAIVLHEGVRQWTLNTMLQPSVDMTKAMEQDDYPTGSGDAGAGHVYLISEGEVPKGEVWSLLYVEKDTTVVATRVLISDNVNSLSIRLTDVTANADKRWFNPPLLLDSRHSVYIVMAVGAGATNIYGIVRKTRSVD